MPSRCWYCHLETTAGHLCPSCGRIQPLPEGRDHFDLFGLPRRLHLETPDLEQRFYVLSRALHPDRHQTGSPYERELSEEWTSALNVAYETLRNPVARAEYLLGLEGVRLEQGREKAPPELFEELLEVQETLEALREAEAPDEVASARSQALQSKARLEVRLVSGQEQLEALFASWDSLQEGREAGADAGRTRILEAIRERLGELAYLRTTLRDVNKALEGRGVTGEVPR